MTSGAKVAEIFQQAGMAFSRLGELTMSLQSAEGAGGKWSEAEVEMLRDAVRRFGHDVNRISEQLKTKSINQIRNQIKRKAFKEAGLDSSISQSTVQKNSTADSGGISDESLRRSSSISRDGGPDNKIPRIGRKQQLPASGVHFEDDEEDDDDDEYDDDDDEALDAEFAALENEKNFSSGRPIRNNEIGGNRRGNEDDSEYSEEEDQEQYK